MINRRLLRIKVMQGLFAYFLKGADQLGAEEKNLFKSIEDIYRLYVWQMALLLELRSHAEGRMLEAKQKYLPSSEDLNPNTRFIDNSLLLQLLNNNDLNQKSERYAVNWSQEDNLIRGLYARMQESEFYKEYLDKEENSYEDDKQVLLMAVSEIMAPSDDLAYYYEEMNIHWGDDVDWVNQMIHRTLQRYKSGYGEGKKLPSLYKEDPVEAREDQKFVSDLFRNVIMHNEAYDEMIRDKAKNWELERIAQMDMLLIKMALAELMEFPSIPKKVTLNEYIELAKMYSTKKSHIFVNGILDKLVDELSEKKKISKTGRGLME